MQNQPITPQIGALNPNKRDFHEVANIFPMLSQTDLQSLADDIKANGQREAIWLHEEKIIDGRNRFMACEIAGVEPKFRHWAGTSNLVDFVLSLNLHRRHLTESQRAMVAVNIANLKVGKPQANSANLQNISQSQAAEKMHVSTRSVTTAAKVQREAAPEVVAAVESGAVTVSAAADIATLPKTEQVEAVAGGKEAAQAAAKKGRESKPKKEAEPALSIEDQVDALPLGKALALYGHGGHIFLAQAEIYLENEKSLGKFRHAVQGDIRHAKGPVSDAFKAAIGIPHPSVWEGCPSCKGSLRVGERMDPCNACNGVGFTTRKDEGVSADVVEQHAKSL